MIVSGRIKESSGTLHGFPAIGVGVDLLLVICDKYALE
jgi:hypothetical protein